MRKLLALTLSLLMVFSLIPMTMVSAETVSTVVYNMDEGSRPTSWSEDKRYTTTPGIVERDDGHGYVLKLATYGDTSTSFNFPKSAINTEIGVPVKLTFEMLAGSGFKIENGIDFIAGGTGYKVYDGFTTPTGSWKTITIDLTVGNKYYSNVQSAISKGISEIRFNKNKGTSYYYVDNVTVYTELYSENRQEQEKPAAPVVEAVTGETITVKAVENALYSKDGGATWQTSNTFTGLKGGTDYQLAIKIAQSADFFESPVSDITIGTTAAVFKWNIYSDYFKLSNNTTGGNFSTQYSGDGTYFIASSSVAAGKTATFTSIKSLVAGIYQINLYARCFSGRAPIDITINGTKVASAVNTSSAGGKTGNNLAVPVTDEYLHAEEGPVEIVITTTDAGKLYLNAFEFAKIADAVEKPIYKVTIDGVEAEYKEGTKISLPEIEEGYHYTDGVNNYNSGDIYEVTGEAVLTVELNTYDVTIDGEVAGTVTHGGTFTVPTPGVGYNYTDGTTTYVGGEEITVTAPVAITSTIKTTSYVYTMDEGSRIVSGYTTACNPGEGVFEEVDGNWVFKLPSKADQPTHFTLPEYWYEKEDYKATSISFSISKTSGAAGATEYVEFTDGTNVVKISSGYTGMLSKYTVNVDESLYGYRTFQMKLKGGSNFVDAKDYIYIDDVTVNFEYDHNYVAPTTYDVTIDGEVVATIREGKTFTLPELPAGKYYVGGYEVGQKFTVTEALELTTATYTYDITIDGEVVATVEYGTEYTLPTLEAGKYYVDVTETTFVVTEALSFTTATYTYDITVDGEVVATVEYGTEYTLPTLEAGKYYVDVTETTFVVTEALSFTTATYTFDITIDGTVVATVAYGETFTLPAVAEGMQYVDGFVAGQEFTVTEALSFATEEIPEFAGESTTIVETDDKASIRLGEVNGIRFYTKIDTAALAELVGDKEYQVGTLIAPKDIAGDYLTAEDDCAIVPYDMNEELWDGEIVGSIVNIKPKNWARDFVARAYVLVDGVYYYSDVQCVRNIAGIADAYMADVNSDYANLDANTQAMVEAWAKAND